MMSKRGLNLLMTLRQSDPGLNAEKLSSRRIAGIGCALGVNDTAACSHPIDFTRLDRLHCPEVIAMHDFAGEQVGHRRETYMGMRGYFKGPALNQLQRPELIKEDKGTHGSTLGRWQCPHHVETTNIAPAR